MRVVPHLYTRKWDEYQPQTGSAAARFAAPATFRLGKVFYQ